MYKSMRLYRQIYNIEDGIGKAHCEPYGVRVGGHWIYSCSYRINNFVSWTIRSPSAALSAPLRRRRAAAVISRGVPTNEPTERHNFSLARAECGVVSTSDVRRGRRAVRRASV